MPNYNPADYPYATYEEARESLVRVMKQGSPSARTDISKAIYEKYPELRPQERRRGSP